MNQINSKSQSRLDAICDKWYKAIDRIPDEPIVDADRVNIAIHDHVVFYHVATRSKKED